MKRSRNWVKEKREFAARDKQKAHIKLEVKRVKNYDSDSGRHERAAHAQEVLILQNEIKSAQWRMWEAEENFKREQYRAESLEQELTNLLKYVKKLKGFMTLERTLLWTALVLMVVYMWKF